MRRGVGRALMTDLMAIARGQGVRRLEVTANRHALAFYGQIGFVADHEVETAFGPGQRMHLDVAP
jgi:GNAT superfamily N-acetyltransferase